MALGFEALAARFGVLVTARRNMVAGLSDAALASLATFAVGIFAVRTLDPALLGGYALCYQAIFLVGIIPANLLFTPAEVAVVAFPRGERLGHLGQSLRLGALPAAAAALLVTLWVAVAPNELPAEAIRALTVTAVATAFLSPVQDHVRRMLHSGGASWCAAIVSAVQLLVVAVVLALHKQLSISVWWIPFGALALANGASLVIALLCAGRRWAGRPGAERLRAGELVRAGRWLVGWSLLSPAAGFIAAAIVSRTAGAEALGYAEGARVVAQPVWVLAVGLSSVLGPLSMAAGRERSERSARRVSRGFMWTVGAAGLTCMLAFGMEWRGNVLSWLLPTAYAVNGLVLVTLLAQTATGLLFPYRSELLGARREAPLTKLEIIASALRVVMAGTARATHAFAIPLGYLAVGIARGIGYKAILRTVYR
ncbi:MAG: hypothetical protein ABR559_10215 [Gemmatimonadota bacterium]